jgi:hypothetical protein
VFTLIFTVTLICFIVAGILLAMYQVHKDHVIAPRKLDENLADALNRVKPDAYALEPERQEAAAISYNTDRIVVIRKFDKVTTKTIAELFGIEIFIDDKVVARVTRSGQHKSFDDISPSVSRVTLRLIFDDPTHPDFELILWDPHDKGSARAEGPRAALENARDWFYVVEAILRRPLPQLTPKFLPPSEPDPEPKHDPLDARRSGQADIEKSQISDEKGPRPVGLKSDYDIIDFPVVLK